METKAGFIQPGVSSPPYALEIGSNYIPLYPKDGLYFGDNIFKPPVEPAQWPEITILTIFCGRWSLFGVYLRNLQTLDYPKDKIHLLLFCTSKDIGFKKMLKAVSDSLKSEGYASVTMENGVGNLTSPLILSEKNGPLTLHLDGISTAYKQAFELVKTNYCFSVEDDQSVPSHSLKKLLNYFSHKDVAIASGVAKNRHLDSGFVVFDFYIHSNGSRIVGLPVDRRKLLSASCVGSSGLGCTVLEMNSIRKVDISYSLPGMPDLLGCDVILGYQMNSLGKYVIADFDVYSYHLNSKGDIC